MSDTDMDCDECGYGYDGREVSDPLALDVDSLFVDLCYFCFQKRLDISHTDCIVPLLREEHWPSTLCIIPPGEPSDWANNIIELVSVDAAAYWFMRYGWWYDNGNTTNADWLWWWESTPGVVTSAPDSHAIWMSLYYWTRYGQDTDYIRCDNHHKNWCQSPARAAFTKYGPARAKALDKLVEVINSKQQKLDQLTFADEDDLVCAWLRQSLEVFGVVKIVMEYLIETPTNNKRKRLGLFDDISDPIQRIYLDHSKKRQRVLRPKLTRKARSLVSSVDR